MGASKMLVYLIAALASLSLLAQVSMAVKHEDFKTCEQSSFCRRHRAFADLMTKETTDYVTPSPYSVVPDSVHLDGHSLVVSVQHNTEKVPLKVTVDFLESGAVRIRGQEEKPLKPRFDDTQKYVLRNQGSQLRYAPADSVKLQSDAQTGASVHTASYATASNSSFSVRVAEKPWTLEYLQGEKLIMQLNTKGFFHFEHLREMNDSDEVSGEDGTKEETFRSWTDTKPRGPESFGMDINFNGFEHVFGIPEHASSFSLKNTRGGDKDKDAYSEPYRLYNLDVFEYLHDSPMALYGAVPFMVAHNTESTVGVFWLNSAETWIDVTREKPGRFSNLLRRGSSGKESSVSTHWASESGVIDVFLLPGPSTAALYKQYAELVEPTPLPRQFALGYHQCRWNYLDQEDVLAVNDKMHQHSIPYDVIWLDIEHTDGKRYFTWDTSKFPDPVAMQDRLAVNGHRLVNVVDPHIKHDSDYRIWKEANENGYFVKNRDNTDNFQGWCWPGDSNWVDYLNPKASKWISEQFHLDKYNGSTSNLFVWDDMSEPAVFNGPEITMDKDIKHHGGWEHRDVHNLFGMLYHKATSDGLRTRESPNRRPFVLSRPYFAGSQRYGAIWTGDNAADWEHLRVSIPMLLSNNIAGMHFSGADVGGFFGNPSPELLTRWYQLGIWYPFFRAHAHIDTKRREPWVVGDPYMSHIRDALRERYRLLPFWYSLFREASLTGMPLLRPVWMEYPKQASWFAEDKSFMVGSSILVVPVLEPSTDSDVVEVRFPTQDNWYDLRTLETFTSVLKRQLAVDLSTTLAYVRGGSIIPTRERQRESSEQMQYDPLTLYVFASSRGKTTGLLYVDDGESYDYTKGAFIERELAFSKARLTSRPSDRTVESPEQRAFADKMARVRVERVVVVGLRNPITKATVRENGQVREIEVNYGGSKKDTACVIRDPAVRIGNDWEITLR